MSAGEAMPGLTHEPPSVATGISRVTGGTLSRPQPQTHQPAKQGEQLPYNRFEKYRSQESLRYVQSDRVHTCELSDTQFHFFTEMAPKDFRIYLSGPPFGLL
jgi:hypothetical protein